MSEFSGLKVLVVEDEGGVALMIEDMLEDLGCQVVASVARFSHARDIAATIEADFALLDVNLDGQSVFPVAEVLCERRIPIAFSTGYGASGLPREMASHPVLGKPFSMKELEHTIALALAR